MECTSVNKTTTNSQFDEHLLISGTFSDVTVKCGDKIWALHRNILSSRCKFFRKALQADMFKESMERVIELHDQDPDHVKWIIHFIYTEKLSKGFETLIRGQASEMTVLIDLYTTADFFMLDRLCAHVVKTLNDIITEHSTRLTLFLAEKGTEKLHEFDDKAFLANYLKTVKIVYNVGSNSFLSVKNTLLSYPKLTNYVVLQDDLLGKKVFTDPDLLEFARDNLKVMVGSPRYVAEPHVVGDCTCRFRTPADDFERRGKRLKLNMNNDYATGSTARRMLAFTQGSGR